MKIIKNAFLAVVLYVIIPANSHALGPVDGEIGFALWNNEFETDISAGEIDAGSLMLHGEVWLGDRWGLRAAWFDSDLESTAFSDQSRLQVEVRRRLLKATDNNFFALGAGLEKIELENGSDSNGLRLSAEGRLGLPGPVFLFGRYSWIPILEDAGNFENVSATEFDAGIHVTPIPFVSLRAGYLQYELDYDDTAAASGSGSSTSGFYVGAGLHW